MLQSLRVALRRLMDRPAASASAFLSIAISGSGIVVLAALIYGTQFRQLPYRSADQLVEIGWKGPGGQALVGALTWRQSEEVVDHASVFSYVGRYFDVGNQYTVTEEGSPARRVSGVTVDAGVLATLGVDFRLGRNFSAAEAKSSLPLVIVTSSYWENHLGLRTEISDASIVLDGVARNVVGVLPRDFIFYPPVDILIPGTQGSVAGEGSNTLVIARLGSDATIADASEQLKMLSESMKGESSEAKSRSGFVATPLAESLAGEETNVLWPVLGVVAVLAALACLNVANIMLGTLLSRRGDVAVEMALGATRTRVWWDSMVGALLLLLCGMVSATGVAYLLLPIVKATLPLPIPRLAEVSVDGGVLALVVLATIVLASLCGALLWSGSGVSRPAESIRVASGVRSTGRLGIQPGLIAVQMALTVVLLFGSAWMLASYQRLSSRAEMLNLGDIAAVQLTLSDSRYRDPNAATSTTNQFLQQLTDKLLATPGITDVATTSSVPLMRGLNNWVEIPGSERGQGASVEVRSVSQNYFSLMSLHLLDGTSFGSKFAPATGPVVVVNEAFKKLFSPHDSNFVGRSVRMDDMEWTVAGIVRDVPEVSLRSAPYPTIFVPRHLISAPLQSAMNRWFTTSVLVASRPETNLQTSVRLALQDIDPGVPVQQVVRLTDLAGSSLATEKFTGTLLLVAMALSLLIGAIGIHGVVSQLSQLRQPEFAIRTALGGSASKNAGLLVKQGATWVFGGLLLGLPLTWAGKRILESLLFESGSPSDYTWMAAMFSLFLATTTASIAWPAWRQARMSAAAVMRL